MPEKESITVIFAQSAFNPDTDKKKVKWHLDQCTQDIRRDIYPNLTASIQEGSAVSIKVEWNKPSGFLGWNPTVYKKADRQHHMEGHLMGTFPDPAAITYS